MTKPRFRHAVIAGVGLIGGSLALAGKKAGVFEKVTGVGRSAGNLEDALRLGVVDEATSDLGAAAKDADFFFAATPVESIAPVCVEAAKHLAEGALVTDGGSVKGKIVAELSTALPSSVNFVGGHPIAGTEKSGAAAAFDTLFKNRYTILTPAGGTPPEAVERLRGMWEAVGADVVEMTPDDHDRTMAAISHLPHLVAYALVETVRSDENAESLRRFAAGGFRDTTRIAASDPAMWRDIFSMNRRFALEYIESYERALAGFKRDIEEGRFEELREKIARVKSFRLGMDDHSA